MSTYSGRRSDFTDWLKSAEINRDRNLRLQVSRRLGLDNNGSFYIYYEMLKHFHYPDNLFIVSDEKKAALKKMLDSRNEILLCVDVKSQAEDKCYAAYKSRHPS